MRPSTLAEESNGIIAVLDSQVDFDIVSGALNNPVYRGQVAPTIAERELLEAFEQRLRSQAYSGLDDTGPIEIIALRTYVSAEFAVHLSEAQYVEQAALLVLQQQTAKKGLKRFLDKKTSRVRVAQSMVRMLQPASPPER